MTTTEMSNEFDILYNQVNSNQAPGVDEFEKSVFLTKAQDQVTIAKFDPRGNKFQSGFNINDLGQLRQYDFSTLIEYAELDRVTSQQYQPYDPRAITFVLPDDYFLTLNESVVENYNQTPYIYQIIDISYSDYARLMQKPYQYPTKRSVWKLITKNGTVEEQSGIENNTQVAQAQQQVETEKGAVLNTTQSTKISGTFCELIGKFINENNVTYKMRYVKRPTPIVLVDLRDEGLSIDNVSVETPCKLPEGVHHIIVQRAVELCTAIYNPQALGNLVGVGNASATDLGIISNNSKEKD